MNDLISGAMELLVLGMGTVFVFLGVLVLATRGMSALVRRLAPEVPAAPRVRKPATPSLDARTTRAIEIAIARYRKEH